MLSLVLSQVGFSMDTTNTVMVGTQNVNRVLSSLEIIGRSTHITLLRLREESIQWLKKHLRTLKNILLLVLLLLTRTKARQQVSNHSP